MRKSKRLQIERMRHAINGVSCRHCGRCCRIYAGFELMDVEVETILRMKRFKPGIKEKFLEFGDDGCPFFSRRGGCGIYSQRFNVCVMYPFRIGNNGNGGISIAGECLIAEEFSKVFARGIMPVAAFRGTHFSSGLRLALRILRENGIAPVMKDTGFGEGIVIE